MKKALPIIAILALLAIAGFTLFFIYQARLSDQEEVVQAQMDELREEQIRLAEIEGSLRKEIATSDALTKQAVEAKQMAEAAAAKERQERERLVADLNARLKREAEERKRAELAQQELEAKMQALEKAQQEAQAALVELDKKRAESAAPATEEEQVLTNKVENQLAELTALKEENRTLKERTLELERKQIATEEAIVSVGGEIELDYAEIRSPNVRRREAILFKQRVKSPGE